ncbi:hypothetical protein K0M31_012904, partial [Melipona bicolor]
MSERNTVRLNQKNLLHFVKRAAPVEVRTETALLQFPFASKEKRLVATDRRLRSREPGNDNSVTELPSGSMTRATITTRRTRASRVSLPSFTYHPVTTPLRGPFPAALLFESAPFLPRFAVKKLVPCSFGEIPSRCVPPLLS